ncbi:unnamed protein product [Rangifer tarandus platyrhynchus]|uniref:Uncharacterized protein n=1 Tax=Rangifer tarandus platyrhynchus TaxID=3082113 RepID=A0ABN8XLR8_RANTA|nr:unnamed protein product [Rangifer tarandus platyrhynchus]
MRTCPHTRQFGCAFVPLYVDLRVQRSTAYAELQRRSALQMSETHRKTVHGRLWVGLKLTDNRYEDRFDHGRVGTLLFAAAPPADFVSFARATLDFLRHRKSQRRNIIPPAHLPDWWQRRTTHKYTSSGRCSTGGVRLRVLELLPLLLKGVSPD